MRHERRKDAERHHLSAVVSFVRSPVFVFVSILTAIGFVRTQLSSRPKSPDPPGSGWDALWLASFLFRAFRKRANPRLDVWRRPFHCLARPECSSLSLNFSSHANPNPLRGRKFDKSKNPCVQLVITIWTGEEIGQLMEVSSRSSALPTCKNFSDPSEYAKIEHANYTSELERCHATYVHTCKRKKKDRRGRRKQPKSKRLCVI